MVASGWHRASLGPPTLDRACITDAYLTALALKREAPSFAFLSEIARRHIATFSFASIGPRLGDDLPLDLPSLFDRIVVRRRGGYCFEQNGLAFEMLAELGFEVTLVLGRVLLNMDVHPGLTHRITLLHLDGERYLFDVGFGPLGPRAPVNMSVDAAEPADHPYWVTAAHPGELSLQTRKDGAPWTLYRFELSRWGQADCEVGHFYSHKHPRANFVNNLIACRKLNNEIRSLRNREYWVLKASGDEKRVVEDAADLRRILDGELGLHVSEAESEKLFGGIVTS